MSMQTIAVAFMVLVAVGGVLWVFVYPSLSGERTREQRVDSVAKAAPPARRGTGTGAGRTPGRSRREQVEETLKELEARHKKTRPSLSVRIAQAGLDWSKQRFMLASLAGAAVAGVLGLILGGYPEPRAYLVALGLAFFCGFGVPLWVLSHLKHRREAKFLAIFPDAVDVIVRGVKSGLPLLDSMKVIVNDSPEPVSGEFRAIVETQAIGIPLGDACGRLYERIPLAEANFFAIVVAIQQKAGGNLSEALGNLSRVLRDRKRMKAKIQAMSMEAKASAGIIGALPFCVMGIVYVTSPDYISMLWTETTGLMMLGGAGLWMTLGVLVMKKMINFDF